MYTLHRLKTKYQTEKVHCPECLGDGTLTYERPEKRLSYDLPQSLEEYTKPCWACGGSGETDEVDEIDF